MGGDEADFLVVVALPNGLGEFDSVRAGMLDICQYDIVGTPLRIESKRLIPIFRLVNLDVGGIQHPEQVSDTVPEAGVIVN